MAAMAHRRYAEIMRDVEGLINRHIAHQRAGTQDRSKLKLLVPSVGTFFTPLNLEDAFIYQDKQRFISSRRFVPPSFNDIRLILNTAQVIGLFKGGPLNLVTFDGDVTLYDDGESLTPGNPVIPRILGLLQWGTRIGIVTAAGYTDASRYYGRLHGLLDAIRDSKELTSAQKQNLVVMGGESNYLFKFDIERPNLLTFVPREEWTLEEMKGWTDEDVKELLDTAEVALRDAVKCMQLNALVLRKERAVGGNDVFVDIGDKSWGVLACQRFFGGIDGGKSLHVGDQFLSAGANDFKARLVCTTAWIASPAETVQLLDEIYIHSGRQCGES
ncbi:MAG: IMP 5'-nucleotidase [Geoglossum umbratile]|nr:MAG: IMP 5'-nucleotidase [Geoglossum umbratile]